MNILPGVNVMPRGIITMATLWAKILGSEVKQMRAAWRNPETSSLMMLPDASGQSWDINLFSEVSGKALILALFVGSRPWCLGWGWNVYHTSGVGTAGRAAVVSSQGSKAISGRLSWSNSSTAGSESSSSREAPTRAEPDTWTHLWLCPGWPCSALSCPGQLNLDRTGQAPLGSSPEELSPTCKASDVSKGETLLELKSWSPVSLGHCVHSWTTPFPPPPDLCACFLCSWSVWIFRCCWPVCLGNIFFL